MRRRRLGFWYRVAVVIIKPPLLALTRRDWRGGEHLRTGGGVIVAANHLSHVDPFNLALFVHDQGRPPRFMAKIEVFRIPVGGRIVKGAGQIPVLRNTANAGDALRAAVEALQAGEAVVIYPEGTVTKDPDLWPMKAKTGVARLALLSGAPVVPVGQWGSQEILGPDRRLRLLPRKTIRMLAGPPIDLSGFQGAADDAATLREITDLVMGRIRAQVGVLRGATPPVRVYDPARDGRAAEPDRSGRGDGDGGRSDERRSA